MLKMKSEYAPKGDTWLVLIVDRSGSMASIQHDMEGGINQLFKDQAEVDGRCLVTMSQFDTEFEMLAEKVPVERIDSYALIPRGGTALLDAIGRTISNVGSSPSNVQVIVAIVTDGEENQSREWSQKGVKDLVERKIKDGWQFTYLGANQDAITVARDMGIPSASTMDYAADPDGVRTVFATASAGIASTRTTGDSISYSDEDREAAKPSNP